MSETRAARPTDAEIEYPVDDISAGSPDMSEAEMDALKQSIASIGQQVPILVWRGRVVDGRKRLAACEALKIKPRVTVLADSESPSDHAMALNLLRTHYTPSQRAAFAERMAGHLKRGGRPKTESPNLGIRELSMRETARAFDVQPSQIDRARRVRRVGAPEVIGAVESGRLTLHAAEQIATKVPHADQPRVVEEVVREAKGKRNTPSKIINAAAPGKRLPPRRDVTLVRERSLRTIHSCCVALDQFMDTHFSEESDFAGWREWISQSLAILNKFNRRLEKSCERRA